jgi:hypothetical protein
MEPSPISKFINKVLKHQHGGGGAAVNIPEDVKKEARNGITLMRLGFLGGTPTGWHRAVQLSGKTIDLESLAVMRAWFARHGPDASNGGTSYRGYHKWELAGKPTSNVPKDSLRAAVAWLIWGGDPAYRWLKSPEIRGLLKARFPDKKEASTKIKI